MLGNVHPNMVMIVLRDLIETLLYKYLNVTIHHQWASLFVLHMNSEFLIFTYNNASFDNFNSDNAKIHYTPTDSMIHNFLDVPKLMDYESSIFYLVYMLFICDLQIYIFNLSWTHMHLQHIAHHI
jgi:hypothetical protein